MMVIHSDDASHSPYLVPDNQGLNAGGLYPLWNLQVGDMVLLEISPVVWCVLGAKFRTHFHLGKEDNHNSFQFYEDMDVVLIQHPSTQLPQDLAGFVDSQVNFFVQRLLISQVFEVV